MTLRLSFLACVCAFAGVTAVPTAFAQEMGQGEANITATAQVHMSLESGAATNSAKLQRIADAIASTLGPVRECYRNRVQERPVTQGELRLMVGLEDGGSVDVTRDSVEDEPLLRCVLAAMRAAPLADVPPPGAAFAILRFDNSAAEGVSRTQERRAVEDEVDVTTNDDGRLEARGGNAGGEVEFVVIGRPNAQAAQVAAIQRSLRAAIPVLLDCRRKAARRTSPAGEVTLEAAIPRRGRARIRVIRSSVEDARGGRCLSRFLPRQPFEEAARGAARIVVRFNETASSSGALHPQEGVEPTP